MAHPALPDGPLYILIRGRVQGVGFRDSMVIEAVRLGARGWVRNRADGAVEAVFDADAAARTELLAWAWRGPAVARVTHVETRAASVTEIAMIGFDFTRLPSAR